MTDAKPADTEYPIGSPEHRIVLLKMRLERLERRYDTQIYVLFVCVILLAVGLIFS